MVRGFAGSPVRRFEPAHPRTVRTSEPPVRPAPTRLTMPSMKTLSAAIVICALASSSYAQTARNAFEIRTLSTRADLISGGDVLVQVTVPPTTAADKLAVAVNGRDVSADFKLAPHPNTFIGLVKD